MKKLILFSCLLCLAMSCGSSKTEEQETKERDSMDNAQEVINQQYVDSIMNADMNTTDSSAQ
jgi:hypothetical protein